MKNLLLLSAVVIGCLSRNEKSEYEKLLEYEGKYQYTNQTALDIEASQLDTTLYAIIDNAKYEIKERKVFSLCTFLSRLFRLI